MCAFVDEFVEEVIKSSSIFEINENVCYEYRSSNHNAHLTLSIRNSLLNKCMNLLHLPEKFHSSIWCVKVRRFRITNVIINCFLFFISLNSFEIASLQIYNLFNIWMIICIFKRFCLLQNINQI
jgi:hypothetical protein